MSISNRSRISFFISLILYSLFVTPSCSTRLFSGLDTSGASVANAGEPGLSNHEYASRLKTDGWPVDFLNTARDVSYLDDDEKNLILAHNLVRYDPRKFALLYVTEYISYFRGNEFHYPGIETIMITREGAVPAIDLYHELLRTRPMGLLYPSEGLSLAANLHVSYLTRLGIRGHGGQGGMHARIERFGIWDFKIGENISYGNFSAHDALLYMLIDDQVADRSHRRIILTPEFRLAGIGKGKHPAYPTGYTFVINYAYHFTPHNNG